MTRQTEASLERLYPARVFHAAGSGLAGIALASLLAEDGLCRPGVVGRTRSLPKKPHHHADWRNRSSCCSWKAGPATSICSIRSRC